MFSPRVLNEEDSGTSIKRSSHQPLNTKDGYLNNRLRSIPEHCYPTRSVIAQAALPLQKLE